MIWLDLLISLAFVCVSLMVYGAYRTLREPKP